MRQAEGLLEQQLIGRCALGIVLGALGRPRLPIPPGIDVVPASRQKNTLHPCQQLDHALPRLGKRRHNRLRARGFQRVHIRRQRSLVVLWVPARGNRNRDADSHTPSVKRKCISGRFTPLARRHPCRAALGSLRAAAPSERRLSRTVIPFVSIGSPTHSVSSARIEVARVNRQQVV